MRTWMVWLTCLLALGTGGFIAWSLTLGQSPAVPDAPAPTPTSPTIRTTSTVPPSSTPIPTIPAPSTAATTVPTTPATGTPDKPATPRETVELTPLQQQFQQSARRGSDWLFRMNTADGRFVPGYLPALKTVMEGDHYLRQAGAAFALARAARYANDERFAARATQAVLTLLGDTIVDPKDASVRYTSVPSSSINRLASAGLLVMTINELPAPEKDLLERSDQLCNYIRRQLQADGSLNHTDEPTPPRDKKAQVDPDAFNFYPGVALYGLMLSQRHCPEAWKIEAVRKAMTYYRAAWKANKSMEFVPWQSAAYTEAFLATKEVAFAEFVFEMNDWLCGLQYDRIDPRRPQWYGGFQSYEEGKVIENAPLVSTAIYAEGLAEGCRVARQQGDVARYRRYCETMERCLQFVTTLQYTDANTQHFADWYRPALVGAFHVSHQDGNLRIDYTQHAVCALVQYLMFGAKGN